MMDQLPGCFEGFLGEPADIFFKSMLNSGKLLDIENDKLRVKLNLFTQNMKKE